MSSGWSTQSKHNLDTRHCRVKANRTGISIPNVQSSFKREGGMGSCQYKPVSRQGVVNKGEVRISNKQALGSIMELVGAMELGWGMLSTLLLGAY